MWANSLRDFVYFDLESICIWVAAVSNILSV